MSDALLPKNSAHGEVHHFFYGTPDLMCIADLNGCFTKVNPAFCEYLGYSEADLLGKSYLNFLHPEDQEKAILQTSALGNAGRCVDFENRYICKNGEVKCLSWTCTVIDQKVFSIARDITRTKNEAQLALISQSDQIRREAEIRFSEVFDHVGIGLMLTDFQGKISLVNQEICDMLDRSKSELMGQSYFGFLPDDDVKTPENQRLDLASGRTQKFVRERQLVKKDGSKIWVLSTSSVVRNEDGSPKYFIVAHKDITRRRQIEISLENAMKDLSDLKNAIDQSSMVAVTDAQGVILDLNDKFCEVSKYTRAELIGKTHAVVNSNYHPAEFFKELWQTISSGNIWRGEIQNRSKDGSPYWVDTVIIPSLDERGVPVRYTAIRTDISEKKRTESERTKLEAREQAAIEASRLKSEFLANMSHEIRTPLNGILGMTKLLETTPLSVDQKDFVSTIVQSADSLLAIVNDILDLSKIEAGKLELEELDFEPRKLVKEIVKVMEFAAKVKQIRLTLKIEDDCRGSSRGDPGRLRQVLFNLYICITYCRT